MWKDLKEFLGTGSLVAGVGAFYIVILCIAPLVTMWLWNWIIPDITGFKEIGFWQALGLCVIGHCMSGTNSSSSK